MASELHSPLSRARAVHEEWMQVTDSLRRIGHEFNQIIIDSANESKAHRSQAAELEARHRHLVAENDTFRANNEKLQRLLELSQPDPGSAIEFDGAAYRKLRHVRRVMRDLLEDLTTEFGDSPTEGPSLLLQPEPQERAHIREIGASTSSSSRSRRIDPSSNSSGSGNTVRPRYSGKARSSPAMTTVPERSPVSTSRSRPSTTGVNDVISSPKNPQTASTSNKSGSDPSVDVSLHAARHSSGGDDDVWRLSSSRSPRSAEIICPVHIEWLRERLKLDEDTIYSLESLGQMDEHCFHLQIVDNMAFVYDPFSMDGPGESLLMDWGTPNANKNVREYVVEKCPRDRVLHTFTFPVKRGVWFYIGAHAWNIKELFPVWPTLGDKAKDTVTAKLRRRGNRRHSQQDVTQMIGDGQLQQFCIQVNSLSLKALSKEFAKTRLGYDGGNLVQ